MRPPDGETRVPAPLPHSRLLQPLDAGPEDGPGGARGAGEAEAAGGGGADGRPWRALDPGRVPLVHLPVRGRPAGGGEGARLGPGPAAGPCADPPLPPQTVLRVWDCLFSEGSKILFRVALTLLKHHQASILEATSIPDLCEKFKEITRGRFVTECHSFMQVGVGHARGPWGPREGLQDTSALTPHPPCCQRGAVPPGTPPSRPAAGACPAAPWLLPSLGGDPILGLPDGPVHAGPTLLRLTLLPSLPPWWGHTCLSPPTPPLCSRPGAGCVDSSDHLS